MSIGSPHTGLLRWRDGVSMSSLQTFLMRCRDGAGMAALQAWSLGLPRGAAAGWGGHGMAWDGVGMSTLQARNEKTARQRLLRK